MDIELRFLDSCPNWKLADERIHEALRLAGLDGVEITYTHVETVADPERLGFIGSPTILINGSDPFVSVSSDPGLACRVYATKDGLQGSPTADELRACLT